MSHFSVSRILRSTKKPVDIADRVDILADNVFDGKGPWEPFMDRRERKKDKNLAQIGILGAIPMILIVAPMIGYFAGKWADGKFGTDPYLMVVGLALGFAAGAREIFNLIKKAQSLDTKKDDDKNGIGIH